MAVPADYIYRNRPFLQEHWPLDKGNTISTFAQPARCQRVYLTRDKFVGLGRASIEQGDGVCVLFGFRLPVIMRKIERHYVLIGPTYLQGWMDGKVFDMFWEDNLVQIDFEIH